MAAIRLAVVLFAGIFSTGVRAEFNGWVENLSEGYMLFQAIEACELSPAPEAVEALAAAIRNWESSESDDERERIWAAAGKDMPAAQMLGLCPVLGAEIDLLGIVEPSKKNLMCRLNLTFESSIEYGGKSVGGGGVGALL